MRTPAIPNVPTATREQQACNQAIRQRLESTEMALMALQTLVTSMQKPPTPQMTAVQAAMAAAPPAAEGSALDDAIAALGWDDGGAGSGQADDALEEATAALGWKDDIGAVSQESLLRAGIVSAWPGLAASVPAGWLIADGSVLLISDYPELYVAIGIIWGGDGVTNFALPALSDRYLIGVSGTHAVGSLFGNADHEIDVKHRHAASDGGGALVNAAAGNHTHGVGGVSTVSAGSHSHGGGTGLNDTVQEVQSGSGQFVAGAGHVHAISTSVDGAHTHAVSGATDGAGAHNHTISGSTAEALITKVNIQPLTAAVYWIIKT